MNTTNKLGPTAPETQEVLRPKTIADFLSDPPKMTCGYCGKLTQEQAAKIKDLTYERDQLLHQKDDAVRLLQKYDALWKDVERGKTKIARLQEALDVALAALDTAEAEIELTPQTELARQEIDYAISVGRSTRSFVST